MTHRQFDAALANLCIYFYKYGVREAQRESQGPMDPIGRGETSTLGSPVLLPARRERTLVPCSRTLCYLR